MNQTALVILAVPFGLLAGGFATMWADRGLDDTPLSLRSRCPSCGSTLSWIDVIPVVSWFRLGRSCSNCGYRIPVSYPIVEVATAALFVLVALRYDRTGWGITVPLVLAVAGMALCATDLHQYRLPKRIVYQATLVSLVLMAVLAFIDFRDPALLVGAIGGALGYWAFLFVINLVSPRLMGFGDVRLALLLGLHSGWIAMAYFGGGRDAVRLTFWTIMLGNAVYIAYMLVVVGIRSTVDRGFLPDPLDEGKPPEQVSKIAVPLGPGLIGGAWIIMLYPQLVLG